MKLSVFMISLIVIITLSYNLAGRDSYTDYMEAIKNLIKTIIVSKKPLELRYECLSTKLNYTTLGEAAFNCLYKDPTEKKEKWYVRKGIFDEGYKNYMRYLNDRKLDQQIKYEEAQLRRLQISEPSEESELSDALGSSNESR